MPNKQIKLKIKMNKKRKYMSLMIFWKYLLEVRNLLSIKN